jgi:hypothetical protein
MKHNKIALFLLVELVLYIFILFVPGVLPSGVFHFTSIVVCLLFLLLNKVNSKKWNIILIGMIFTVIADYFLTLRGTEQLLGTIFFAFAQLMFGLVLHVQELTHKSRFLIARLVFVLAFLGISYVVVGSAIDVLVIVAVFYYSNLVYNAVVACRYWRRDWLFALGLLFYICCDTLVGLSQSADYLYLAPDSIWVFLLNFPINLIWLFYLPSQMLIVLSTQKHQQLKMDESS